MSDKPYHVVGLNYVTVYFADLETAVAFYTRLFGPPDNKGDNGKRFGWKMGSTWLTMFPSEYGTLKGQNPCNAEFAIEVNKPEEVDALYNAFLEAGAKACMPPENTEMYYPMRFCCVDDPFGMRVDIYCPIDASLVGK
jgi:catechol 2,3-dioxygenase-like lactoylglutathione lyase family enzyme